MKTKHESMRKLYKRLSNLLLFPCFEVAPRVTLQSGPVYWQGGKNGSLACNVTGFPKPIVTWSKSPGQLSVQRMMTSDTQQIFTSIQKSDSGLYTCRATNLLGTRVATAIVVVYFAAEFVVRPPSTLTVSIGKTVKLNCSVKGEPQPVVTWRREDGQLPLGRSETRSGAFIIRRVEMRDSGKYICSGTSHAALKGVKAVVQLNVKGQSLFFVGQKWNSSEYSYLTRVHAPICSLPGGGGCTVSS